MTHNMYAKLKIMLEGHAKSKAMLHFLSKEKWQFDCKSIINNAKYKEKTFIK